jgi:hypothetical protein
MAAVEDSELVGDIAIDEEVLLEKDYSSTFFFQVEQLLADSPF